MTIRRRTKIILALIVVVAAGVWIFVPNTKAKRRAERMRRELRAEGFKIETAEFNLAVSPEVRARTEAVIAAGHAVSELIPNRGMGFFQPAGSNAAIVLAKEEQLSTEFSPDHWPTFRATLEAHKAELDAACDALMGGPIRFEPAQAPGGDLLVSYLMEVRSLSAALAARTLVELHDQHHAEAWTNLLALTRLATGWDAEPVEFAHFIKFSCATTAARVTWEAAQMHALNKEEIAGLLKEWKRLDVFKGLPETAELSCALILHACETERQRPAGPALSTRQMLGDLFDSPGRGWSEMTAGWRESRYRHYGAYEDEATAMVFYQGRERSLWELAKGMPWAEARSLEGITNLLGSGKGESSRLSGLLNQPMTGSPRVGPLRLRSLPARAAETEARRRLVCTGLALEDFYVSHASYPRALSDLAPGFVAPVDFMDGKPLRYRAVGERDFVMYSTGLDCVDDGGIMRWETNQFGGGRGFFRAEEPDMLWPRAATAEEIDSEKRMRQLARREGGGGENPRGRRKRE